MRAVVQTSRLVRAYARCARARRARSARPSAWACCTIWAASSRSRPSRFPRRKPGKGTIRFNDTAGSMAKDSVFNATSVLRAVTGIDVGDFDLHINVVGGGNIDGPSAGLAIFLALYSAITKTPLPQDVAITGELSIQGKVRGVGGVVEKALRRASGRHARVLIPEGKRARSRSPIALGHRTIVAQCRDACDQALREICASKQAVIHQTCTSRPQASRRRKARSTS